MEPLTSWFIRFKQHNIFKNAFSLSKSKHTIAEEIFMVFSSFLMFLLISDSLSFINFLRIKARFTVCQLSGFFIHLYTIFGYILSYLQYLVGIRSEDIEKNSGPNSCHWSCSICYWNLNRISTHNFLKLFLWWTYMTVHNFDDIYVHQRLISVHPF